MQTDNAPFIINLACEIQAIPAPTFHEGKRAEFFWKAFCDLGLQDVQIDQAGNVLGRIPGLHGSRTRPLVISAHMDTVHPIETPLVVDRCTERITGPGIGDNALGLAALLGLARALKDRKIILPGDLWLAANTGEEGLGDLAGMQAIVDRFGAHPLAYIVLEGMGLGTVLHRGLGVERYKISVQTPGGHSWGDYGAPSAIHELAVIINRLTAIPVMTKPCSSLNVGIIHGGTSINTIASHAWLELDLRSEDALTLANLVRKAWEAAFSIKRADVHVSMERIGKRAAGQIDPDHPLCTLAVDVLKELGLKPRLDIASTDANLPLSRGLPAICIGITTGENAHTKEEMIQTGPADIGFEQVFLLVTRAWDRLV